MLTSTYLTARAFWPLQLDGSAADPVYLLRSVKERHIEGTPELNVCLHFIHPLYLTNIFPPRLQTLSSGLCRKGPVAEFIDSHEGG